MAGRAALSPRRPEACADPFQGRPESRERARRYLRGLLAPLERRNGWTLIEQTGEVRPDGTQRLLNQTGWDADAVRDEVRGSVPEHLGASVGVSVNGTPGPTTD